MTIERDKKIKELFKLHGNKSKVADLMGVSPRTVGRVLKKDEPKVTKVVRLGGGTVHDIKKVEKVVEIPPKELPKWKFGSDFIEIVDGQNVYMCDKTHHKFTDIREILFKNGDNHDGLSKAISLINTKKGIEHYTQGHIVIENCVLKYAGNVIDNILTKRIVNSMYKGEEFKKYINFLDNLMLNPSNTAVKELYDFLEHNDIVINDDGSFTAYKRVTTAFKDFYTKTFDNSVGKTVSMPRNLVNEDRNETCSYGLHVCAKHYLTEYHNGEGYVVTCNVFPRDVVCIPSDYKNSKMRCCSYKVMCVVK